MSRTKRITGALGVLSVLWLAAMLVGSFALEGRTRRGVVERLSESLAATTSIDRGSLALVRGRLDLERLVIRRDDLVGHLAIGVTDITCDLPPLGLALFDRDCRTLALRGIRMEMSSAALFRLERPRRSPLRAERVVIDDARLELAASAVMPSLGRVVIEVSHAEAGPTVFKTPLSWLFALRTLRAKVELPPSITLDLTYERGELRIAGGMFGATPIALPLALPVADLADDPRAELGKLVVAGKDLIQRLLARKAEAWIKSKLSP